MFVRRLATGVTACAAVVGLWAGALPGSAQAAEPFHHDGAVQASSTQTQRGGSNGGSVVRFGTTVFEQQGESYRAAFERQQQTYGRLGVVRMFYPGLPGSWASIASRVGDTPLSVSFKASPQSVLAGDHDAALRTWFAEAPTDHVTRWTYWHEPEDDIDDGVMDAQTYRRAWRHINRLANEAHNRKLRATLILMCWTPDRRSGRTWQDYYPGNRTIDIMSFDCYSTFDRTAPAYRDPNLFIGPAVDAAESVGKPWGIAELGTVVINSDYDGSGRAAWLDQVSDFLAQRGARYCTYFDSYVGQDYRLHDEPSRTAWRQHVEGQWG